MGACLLEQQLKPSHTGYVANGSLPWPAHPTFPAHLPEAGAKTFPSA